MALEAFTDPFALGLVGSYLVAFFVLMVVFYIYGAIALMKIANRLGHNDIAWLAWIPIVNVYLVVKMSGAPMWSILLILAFIIPFLGGLVTLAAVIWWFWLISEKVGYPGWLSLLNIIPFGGLVLLGILAWGKP